MIEKDDKSKLLTDRKKKDNKNKKSFFSEYSKIIKKMYKPDRETWWRTFWRVSVILTIAGIVLFLLDWLLLKSVLGFQGFLPEFDNTTLKIIYIVFIFLTGLISIVGVLAQQGDASGLTAMLGSSVQYGDITGSYSKKISKTTYIAGGLLMVLCLFAPLFLTAGSVVAI